MLFSLHHIIEFLYKKGYLFDFYIYSKFDDRIHSFKTDFKSIEMFLLTYCCIEDNRICIEKEHCSDFDRFVFYKFNRDKLDKGEQLFSCSCNFSLLAIDSSIALSISESKEKNS